MRKSLDVSMMTPAFGRATFCSGVMLIWLQS
jgi:hypothetical protein